MPEIEEIVLEAIKLLLLNQYVEQCIFLGIVAPP